MKKITQLFLTMTVVAFIVPSNLNASDHQAKAPGDSVKMKLYPCPATSQIQIESDKARPDATVHILALDGKEVYRGRFGNGIILFNDDAKYPARSAVYVIKVTNPDGKYVESKQFVKFRG